MIINRSKSPYSNDQILEYLKTVKFFEDPDAVEIEGKSAVEVIEGFQPTLENLDRLIRCQLIAFPFETLSMM